GFYMSSLYYCIFFFFQAEDGIRDSSVTGVQTCALPILVSSWSYGATHGAHGATRPRRGEGPPGPLRRGLGRVARAGARAARAKRSEERRVGQEGGCWGGGVQRCEDRKTRGRVGGGEAQE